MSRLIMNYLILSNMLYRNMVEYVAFQLVERKDICTILGKLQNDVRGQTEFLPSRFQAFCFLPENNKNNYTFSKTNSDRILKNFA